MRARGRSRGKATHNHKWLAGRLWLRDSNDAPNPNALRRRGQSVGKRLVAWYKVSGRDFPWRTAHATLYQRVVTEVLLQQTRAAAVAKEYAAIFGRFPSWKSLASASTSEIEGALKPLGLWRRRARSLQGLARAIVNIDGALPQDRDKLERLPAVGQYVASAILVFEYGLSEPLLDVNMGRVLERYFGLRTRADLRYDIFMQKAARACIKQRDPAIVNWAFLDLGSMVCKHRTPLCQACPISRGCYYAKTHRPRGDL